MLSGRNLNPRTIFRGLGRTIRSNWMVRHPEASKHGKLLAPWAVTRGQWEGVDGEAALWELET